MNHSTTDFICLSCVARIAEVSLSATISLTLCFVTYPVGEFAQSPYASTK